MDKSKKNVFMLGLVSFFTDVSSEMIFPILPIFLTSVLKANMAAVGFVEGIAESTAALLKVFSGYMSDRFSKNKLLILFGYGFSTATKPILALATAWQHVLFVRFADRAGKGIRTSPRDALIAASTTHKERGSMFGLHRTMDSFGAVVGTLLAALLLYFFASNYRLVFWLSGIPGVIAVLIIIFLVTDKETERKKKYDFRWSKIDLNFKKFLVINTIFSLAVFSYAFFLLRAKDVGLAIALLPIIYLVYNVVNAVFSIPAGRLSDRIGRKNTLVIGYVLFALLCVGFAFIANIYSIWLLFAAYGLFMAFTDGVSRAFVSDLVQEENRGTGLGLYHMLVGIAIFPANLIGGFLWDKINPQAPFMFAAALAVVSSVLLWWIVKDRA